MLALIGVFVLGFIVGVVGICIVTSGRIKDQERTCLRCAEELRSKMRVN